MFKNRFSNRNSERRNVRRFSRSRSGVSFGRVRSDRQHRSKKGAASRVFSDVSKFVHKAVLQETEVYTPKHLFSNFQIDERLKRNIAFKKYVTPTPIQDQAIPYVLEGRDVVGIANTGTGKTGAFLIPCIHKVVQNVQEKVLIIVPTRELAFQIQDEFREFVRGSSLQAVSCIGGANINAQIRSLRYRYNFVIGTPGRLKDLIQRKCLILDSFKTVVLDEADRMLDMGFIHDMKFILGKMHTDRQSLFFSATMSPEIRGLVSEFLKDPIHISVKTQDTALSVDQDVVRVGAKNKIEVLHDLLCKSTFCKVLIFGKTKHGVERLCKELIVRGFKAEAIHGNKTQARRQRSLDAFKYNKAQVLVATDVAARGLDIPDVSHVINYDLPATYEDYIHRIGRTGRASKKGVALTFVE